MTFQHKRARENEIRNEIWQSTSTRPKLFAASSTCTAHADRQTIRTTATMPLLREHAWQHQHQMLKYKTPWYRGLGQYGPLNFSQFPLSGIPTRDFTLSLLRINPWRIRDAFMAHTAVTSLSPGLGIWLCSGIFQQMQFMKTTLSLH